MNNKSAISLRIFPWADTLLATCAMLIAPVAKADELSDLKAQLHAMQQQQAIAQQQTMALQQQLDKLTQKLEQQSAQVQAQAVEVKAVETTAQATQIQAALAADRAGVTDLDANGHSFLEHKKGEDLTFYVPHGETRLYGNLDVSADYAAKNVGGVPSNYGASPPAGNWGWMPDLSTNLSYLGVRGFEELGPETSFNFVYQLEAGFDVTAAPGLKETNSSQSNTVNGTLFNRNSYVGLSSPTYGAIKIGKTDAPYKNSTAALNPFSGELGDYASIMGNTGGDNRVEFGARLDHSIWYESPTWSGFQYNFLFSPGQNRDNASGDLAAGESDCTGGNAPQSGGDLPALCNDGGWSNAYSGNISYTHGPLYLTAAGELHEKVNRQSDITGMFGATSAVLPDAYSQNLYNQDTGNEWATKIAAQYTFSTKTTISAIGEYMHRDVPSDLEFQDERTRYGTWLTASQQLTDVDSLHFGWAHAFQTPGDPGQHNDSTIPVDGGQGSFASNKNQADMLTLAVKHMITPSLMLYSDWAMLDNGPSAHYALGAGGHGVTTDCHDASGATGGTDSTPHCYTGQTIMGVSAGLKYTF